MKEQKLKSQKGFTLVELVIVITILAILSVTGVQLYGNVTTKAKVQADFDNGQNIGSAIARAIADGRINSTPAAGELFIANSAAAPVVATNPVLGELVNAAGVGGAYLSTIPPIKAMRPGAQWRVDVNATNGNVTVSVVGNTGSNATQTIRVYPKAQSYTAAQAPYNLFNN